MPNIILEYSDNLIEHFEASALFNKLHQAIVRFPTFKLSELKSRAIRHSNYFAGDGNPRNAFVYLQVALLTGRDEALRKELGQTLLQLLESEFAASRKALHCSITCEIREMDRNTHFKSILDT